MGEPPAPTGKAKELWEEGTRSLKRGDVRDAIALYTQALELRHGDSRLLSNRSAAWLVLGDAESSLADAEKCIQSAPRWVKGYVRAAMALRLLGRHPDAVHYLDKASMIQPLNQEVLTLRSCTESEGLFVDAISRVDSPRSPSPRRGREYYETLSRPSPETQRTLSEINNIIVSHNRDQSTPTKASPPGARRVCTDDGTSFTTFFTAPNLVRRNNQPASQQPSSFSTQIYQVPSPCPPVVPPPELVGSGQLVTSRSDDQLDKLQTDVVGSSQSRNPIDLPTVTISLTRIIASLLSLCVPVLSTLACRDSHALLSILVGFCSFWGVLLPAAIPESDTDPNAKRGTRLGTVVQIIIILVACAAAKSVVGDRSLKNIVSLVKRSRCALLLMALCGQHLFVSNHVSDSLRVVGGGVSPAAAARLASWLTPGLIANVVLIAVSVFSWCSAMRSHPTTQILISTSALLLVFLTSTGLIAAGIAHADGAVQQRHKQPASDKKVVPLGLPPREWIWLAVTGALVASFFSLSPDQQSACVCDSENGSRKWTLFGF
eukprot:TRINITY_DN1128_c1_g1_i1.p1 TRINITY_DN1128_c1_g1~~TRINITY_DN1128_c1_g1_i1.p1  ORF type:complete len:546 (+),score=69.41 TRINITY_DN1128_c1_g1_i1:46-1683(+)